MLISQQGVWAVFIQDTLSAVGATWTCELFELVLMLMYGDNSFPEKTNIPAKCPNICSAYIRHFCILTEILTRKTIIGFSSQEIVPH